MYRAVQKDIANREIRSMLQEIEFAAYWMVTDMDLTLGELLKNYLQFFSLPSITLSNIVFRFYGNSTGILM